MWSGKPNKPSKTSGRRGFNPVADSVPSTRGSSPDLTMQDDGGDDEEKRNDGDEDNASSVSNHAEDGDHSNDDDEKGEKKKDSNKQKRPVEFDFEQDDLAMALQHQVNQTRAKRQQATQILVELQRLAARGLRVFTYAHRAYEMASSLASIRQQALSVYLDIAQWEEFCGALLEYHENKKRDKDGDKQRLHEFYTDPDAVYSDCLTSMGVMPVLLIGIQTAAALLKRQSNPFVATMSLSTILHDSGLYPAFYNVVESELNLKAVTSAKDPSTKYMINTCVDYREASLSFFSNYRP